MKTRIVRWSLAASSGISTGMTTWHELSRSPASSRWKRTIPRMVLASVSWLVGLDTREPGKIGPPPPLTLRGRLSLVTFPLIFLSPLMAGIEVWFQSPEEKQIGYEEWQAQRKRYARFAGQWRQRRSWRRLGLWTQLKRSNGAKLPAKLRATFLALALVSGANSAALTWRRLSRRRTTPTRPTRWDALMRWEPYLALSNPILAYLHISGIMPSRLWIPRQIRRVVLIVWLLCTLPLGLFAALLAAVQIRLALLSGEEYERRYKEAEKYRRQWPEEPRSTKQLGRKKHRRQRRQPRKSE